MKRLPTVTIGIPAHNEAENIRHILRALLLQEQSNYTLENILVFCDGCTDNTSNKSREIAEENDTVKVIDDGQRKGKTGRLREIYETNESDIVINFDADTLPADERVVSRLVERFKDENIVCVSGNVRPIKEVAFVEKLINVWNEVWYEAVKTYKNGQTVHHASSAAMALRCAFAKDVVFPSWTISDGAMVFLTAKRHKLKFRFVTEAIVFARSTTNLKDYLMLLSRYSSQRGEMVKYFGSWVEDEYYLPKIYKCRAVVKAFLANPILTPIVIAFQFLAMRLARNANGMENKSFWEETRSTKRLVIPERTLCLPHRSPNSLRQPRGWATANHLTNSAPSPTVQ